jgi:Domain of unknown function (DUF4861)
MRNFFLLVIFLFSIKAFTQSVVTDYPEYFTVNISNPLTVSRQNILIVISSKQLAKNFNPLAFVIMDGKKEIPSQYNRNDEENVGIVFVLDELDASETRQVSVRFHPSENKPRTYTKRTQAELSYKRGGEWRNREYIGGTFHNTQFLRVPGEHKDHSWFIRYEGPGWESDKVGYRFYLDQRNATDVFGKVTREMILEKVGLDGFDSYHEMQPWGMDVMKVGKSLGIGSIASFVNGEAIRVEKTDSVNCRIDENGDVYSSIVTKYYGWKVDDKKHDVNSHLSIHAGTRATVQTLNVTNDIGNVATGIVKDKAAVLIKKNGDAQHFGYIATYGKQSLNADNLGLAVFFNPNDLIEITEDTNSHVIKLKPSRGKLTYYFLSAWEKEPDGIKDQQQFENYLEQIARELANPVKVVISNKK